MASGLVNLLDEKFGKTATSVQDDWMGSREVFSGVVESASNPQQTNRGRKARSGSLGGNSFFFWMKSRVVGKAQL